MANIHEHHESCKAHMRELIKEKLERKKDSDLTRREVVAECKKVFDGVDSDTFYRWYKSVIKEEEIKKWENDCNIRLVDMTKDRVELKELIYQRNKKTYVDDKDAKEVKEAEKTLLTHFLGDIKLTGIN